jgi:hypothetical protein
MTVSSENRPLTNMTSTAWHQMTDDGIEGAFMFIRMVQLRVFTAVEGSNCVTLIGHQCQRPYPL